MIREEPGRSLTETIAWDLAPTELLLVVDNCEHLVCGCAALADTLLHECPKLRILTTSREALGIGGENTRLVPLSVCQTPRVGHPRNWRATRRSVSSSSG